MDGAIALTVMIFFYAVVVFPLAVHKRMIIFDTDTTIRFILVSFISVETCNAAVCALSYYLQQPGHPLYREDINTRVKYSILTVYATQLIRLAVTFPCVFLENKELVHNVVLIPSIRSLVVTTGSFVSYLGLDCYLNMPEFDYRECNMYSQCRDNITSFIPIWMVLLFAPLIYRAISILFIVMDSTDEDTKSSKSIVIPIVLGCLIMTVAWIFTVNALFVLNPFIRDNKNVSPSVISSLLFVLALTIPAVATLTLKIVSVTRKKYKI